MFCSEINYQALSYVPQSNTYANGTKKGYITDQAFSEVFSEKPGNGTGNLDGL